MVIKSKLWRVLKVLYLGSVDTAIVRPEKTLLHWAKLFINPPFCPSCVCVDGNQIAMGDHFSTKLGTITPDTFALPNIVYSKKSFEIVFNSHIAILC